MRIASAAMPIAMQVTGALRLYTEALQHHMTYEVIRVLHSVHAHFCVCS